MHIKSGTKNATATAAALASSYQGAKQTVLRNNSINSDNTANNETIYYGDSSVQSHELLPGGEVVLMDDPSAIYVKTPNGSPAATVTLGWTATVEF